MSKVSVPRTKVKRFITAETPSKEIAEQGMVYGLYLEEQDTPEAKNCGKFRQIRLLFAFGPAWYNSSRTSG
jgi:hypothetical protein